MTEGSVLTGFESLRRCGGKVKAPLIPRNYIFALSLALPLLLSA